MAGPRAELCDEETGIGARQEEDCETMGRRKHADGLVDDVGIVALLRCTGRVRGEEIVESEDMTMSKVASEREANDGAAGFSDGGNEPVCEIVDLTPGIRVFPRTDLPSAGWSPGSPRGGAQAKSAGRT